MVNVTDNRYKIFGIEVSEREIYYISNWYILFFYDFNKKIKDKTIASGRIKVHFNTNIIFILTTLIVN